MIFLNNLGEIKVFTHCSSQNKFIHLLINEFANLLIEIFVFLPMEKWPRSSAE